MSRRIFFINFILVILVIIEIFSIIHLWSSDGSLSEFVNTDSIKPLKFKGSRILHRGKLPISVYDNIVKKNLFASDRKEYIKELVVSKPEPEVKPEAKPDVKIPDTNNITLYGVIIMDDYKKALVTDIDRTSDRNSIWVKKGDTLGSFTVKDIKKDKLIVANSGKDFFILLYDKKNPKQRDYVRQVNTPAEKVIKTAPAPAKPVASSPSSDKDNDYKIISTPFGQFKVKKRK